MEKKVIVFPGLVAAARAHGKIKEDRCGYRQRALAQPAYPHSVSGLDFPDLIADSLLDGPEDPAVLHAVRDELVGIGDRLHRLAVVLAQDFPADGIGIRKRLSGQVYDLAVGSLGPEHGGAIKSDHPQQLLAGRVGINAALRQPVNGGAGSGPRIDPDPQLFRRRIARRRRFRTCTRRRVYGYADRQEE